MPLKDFRRIAEAMADAARDETDPIQLVEAVRQRIGALIIQTMVPVRMPLPVVTLDASLESLLNQAVRTGQGAMHPIEPGLGQKIVQAIGSVAGPMLAEGRRFAVVTSPAVAPRAGAAARPASAGRAGPVLPRNPRRQARRGRRRRRRRGRAAAA